MRIALTHNLKLSDAPEEAEFDSPETIEALTAALERAGHEVERIEVSGPPSRLLTRLEGLAPDLIFNTAEGHKGKTREAFYPALFDELGMPYTGSDAYTLCITLDKNISKRIVTGYGVPAPRGRLVTRSTIEGGALDDLIFPVIVKPNFEGSSKGIAGDSSVCEDAYELSEVIERQLPRFEAGLIVERYLRGVDVACSFVAGTGADGILPPIEYVIDKEHAGLYNVLDFNLRNVRHEHVKLRPAELPAAVIDRIKMLTKRVVRAFELKDFGLAEFRVGTGPKGYEVHFLAVEALPALNPDTSLALAAKHQGIDFDGVVKALIKSACQRYGLLPHLENTQPRRSKKTSMRVGFTFNIKRSESDEAQAEFDTPRTIQAIAAAIESYGHTVVHLEATPDLPRRLADAAPDVVFNIAEGIRGRGREAQVPALCELLGIPYSGSDSTTQSLCLDKGLTKQILRAAGIETPEWQVITTGREKLKSFRYPVIVKPNAEGTSKGITEASVVEDEAAARAAAKALSDRYGQPALVEEYIEGREFTVGLLGERRPKILPPMEVVFKNHSGRPVYGFEEKKVAQDKVTFECPAKLSQAELKRLEKVVRDTFNVLGCRDVARVDLRLAKDGTFYVIEVNPLPGLTPDFSDLCVIAKVVGMDHRMLIGEILSGCMKRYREAKASHKTGFVARSEAGQLAEPAPAQAAEAPQPVSPIQSPEAQNPQKT